MYDKVPSRRYLSREVYFPVDSALTMPYFPDDSPSWSVNSQIKHRERFIRKIVQVSGPIRLRESFI